HFIQQCLHLGFALGATGARSAIGVWDASMPLTPYLKGGVFEPKQIEAMMAAFEAVCRSLQLADRVDPFTEIVARNVIEIAGTGEHDPERLHDLVLAALSQSGQRTA